LAWSQQVFGEQHAFVLQMIDHATNKHRWDVLDYDPHKRVTNWQTKQ
jgi:hypothetical protein